MMKIFDTHTHLNVDNFAGKESEEIAFARELGVTKMNIVGFDAETIEKSLALSRQYDELYSTIGWHPTEAGSYTQEVEDMLVSHLHDPKVIALGEIGLDYYWDDVPSDKQKEIFQQQVDLAKKHQKPIIIHCRDAYEDTYEVLKRNGHPGIMHCYSGSVEMAKRFIDLGFYISLAGPVTFKNARVPKDVAEKIGLEHLLIETDCPYLTPHPYRGSLNEPANVVYIAQEIAKLKNMEIESVASQTTFNAKKVFGIK